MKTDTKAPPKTTPGFKAFNANLKCQDFQYEVGKTYIHNGPLILCPGTDDVRKGGGGFHFCQFPLAVFDYYPLIGSRFAEVEAEGDCIDDGSKLVTANLTIKKEIGISDLIKAQIGLVFSFCFTEGKTPTDTDVKCSDARGAQLASSGERAQLASSGERAQLASSGERAQLASSGYGAKLASSGEGAQLASSGYGAQLASSGYGAQLAASGEGAKLASSGYGAKLASSGYGAKLASSGERAKLASSGYGAKLASSGERAQLASSGEGAKLASSGEGAQLASSGYGAQLASSGYGAKLASSGERSVVAAIGINNTASAKVGSWITLAEYEHDGSKWVIIEVKTAKVDGEKIKAEVPYKLQNGEFVAAK